MMLKSAIFATVLAAAAATGAASTASAAPAAAPAVLGGIQNTSDAVQQVHWRRTRVVTRCIGGRRVLMRINWRGRVVSRRVIGRCWHHHRKHRHRW
ncbi:MAG TPA: hypothetical protein VF226_06730 [Hyphomicrobiaceae bacterium]|jgi:hypothetical protein